MRFKWFFRLFPPPVFLYMPYAGLEISDDAIRCLAYKGLDRVRRKVASYGSEDLPVGLISGGDIKDDKAMIGRLADFGRKHSLSYVKVSVPEEKAYLFQTEVPDMGIKAVAQNIEFKLEENVPLSAADAVFYFILLPKTPGITTRTAMVSVVPKSYIDKYSSLIESAGMKPIAFELAPRSLARAVVPRGSLNAKVLVHAMDRKTGIYVVSEGAVRFTSTVTGAASDGQAASIESLGKEISRVYSYWLSHGGGRPVDEIILAGRGAAAFDGIGRYIADAERIPVVKADIWANALDREEGIPPISMEDSLAYAVASGLAIDPSLEPDAAAANK